MTKLSIKAKKTNGTKQGREGWEFKIFKENGSIDKLKRPPLKPNWQVVDKIARRLRRANENTRSLSFWGPISHSVRNFFSHRIWKLDPVSGEWEIKDHRQNDILNFNGKNFTEAMFGRNISWLKEPSFLITFPQPGDEKRNDKNIKKSKISYSIELTWTVWTPIKGSI